MLNLEFLRSTIKSSKVSLLENSKGKITVTSLLGTNQKLDKGEDVVTGLTLAPFKVVNAFSNTENVNFCVNGAKCFKTCLFNQAGRYGMVKEELQGFSTCQLAAVKRSLFFKENKEKFLKVLFAEIALKVAELEDNQKIYIRLNVMSDVNFTEFKEKVSKVMPQVVFYDYTKRLDLVTKNTAYSMFNDGLTHKELATVKNNNAQVSVIVNKETKEYLLKHFASDCVDGDKHDLFFKQSGTFVLLAPKGISNKQKKALDKNMTISQELLENTIKHFNNIIL